MKTVKDMANALTCCELTDIKYCGHCSYYNEGDHCHYQLMCDIALYLNNLIRG